MESAIRLAVGFIHLLAWLTWLGAVVFAGYRVHQMRTLPAVEAEVLQAETESYNAKAYRRNAAGWTEETRSRMYVPTALVRYSYQGQVITATAKHDTGVSWKWLQDRVTRGWKPGSRIWIYIDPAKPGEPLAGLGNNLGTFMPAVVMIAFGFFLVGCAYGLTRAGAVAIRLFEAR
jgi:hypothetical protein